MTFDSTIQTISDSESGNPSNSRTLPHPGRFQVQQLLGEGGMGQVYLAFDPQLKRRVAIKTLKSSTQLARLRFANEARLQALVNHPNICKVFEVGEEKQGAFIAMQYVEGQTLREAMPQLDLKTRICLLIQVAEGIHEAHQQNFIHRDLKPGNIMIEERENGTPWPYVMDFGLARSMNEGHMTQTGSLLGTPYFMAPEQANHELTIDPRCDVYALGGILFEMLSDDPPYAGHSSPEIVQALLDPHSNSPTPKKKGLPNDLVMICKKAMHKDASQRYASARAFAEDLQRYLENRPILARAPRFSYRASQFTKRHLQLLVVTACALFLVLCASTYAGWTQYRAQYREQLVQNFTQRLERMDALYRNMVMSPPHDIRESRALLESYIHDIENEQGEMEDWARAPANAALGRAYLRLGNLPRALTYLERAWQAGEQSQQTANALGRTLAQLYNQRRKTMLIQGTPSKEEATELQTLKERALKILSKTKDHHDTLLEAEIAFLSEDYESALRLLKSPGLNKPWFYDVHQLRGNAHRELAYKAAELGNNEMAMRHYQQAEQAIKAALEIAASKIALYRDLIHLKLFQQRNEDASPEQQRALLGEGLNISKSALQLDPDDQETLRYTISLYTGYASALLDRNETKDPTLVHAIEEAQHLAKALEDTSMSSRLLGLAELYAGRLLINKGESSEDMLRAALASFEKVAPKDRDLLFHESYGFTWLHLAKNVTKSAEDEDRAIHSFKAASQLAPDSPYYVNHIGQVYLRRANRLQGPAKAQALEEATHWFEKTTDVSPDHFIATYYLARVMEERARLLNQQGESCLKELEQAAHYYMKGADLRPRMPHFANGLANIWFYRAYVATEQGEDPRPWIEQALNAYDTAIRLAPSSGLIYRTRSLTHLLHAYYLSHMGFDPRRFVAKGIQDLNKAAGLNKDPYDAYSKAKLELARARWLLGSGRDPATTLKQIHKALIPSLKDAFRPVHETEGEAYYLLARSQIQRGQNPEEAFERALEAYGKDEPSFATNLEHLRALLYQSSYLKKKGHSLRGKRKEAQALLNELFCENPNHAEANALRVIQMQIFTPSRTNAILLRDILESHPLLMQKYRSFLTRAR